MGLYKMKVQSNIYFLLNIRTNSDFTLTEKEKEDKKKKILRENARIEKWNKMLSNFPEFYKNNFDKLKERTRKGIPDSLRGLIWQMFAEVEKYRNEEKYANVYNDLVNDEESDLETESVILRDIDRTFPKHTFFKEKYGLGQRSLFNVLRAYSKFNTDTGYVQGMGFIVALMLTYMDEESAFWMVHSLMNKYEMSGYYLKNFPELQRSFYKLLRLMKKHTPKIYELFKAKEIYPTMYASQWFITIFSVNFKFDTLVRIFDVFLLEGEKILYRIALAVLKINEDKITSVKSFEDILGKLRFLFDNLNVDDLFAKAFKFSISKEHLREYEAEYETVKFNTDDEFMKLARI